MEYTCWMTKIDNNIRVGKTKKKEKEKKGALAQNIEYGKKLILGRVWQLN